MAWVVAPSGLRRALPVGTISVMCGTMNRPGWVGFGKKTVEAWNLSRYSSAVVLNCKENHKLIGFQFRNDGQGHKVDVRHGMMRVHCQAALKMAGAKLGHYVANKEANTGMVTVSVDCQEKGAKE